MSTAAAKAKPAGVTASASTTTTTPTANPKSFGTKAILGILIVLISMIITGLIITSILLLGQMNRKQSKASAIQVMQTAKPVEPTVVDTKKVDDERFAEMQKQIAELQKQLADKKTTEVTKLEPTKLDPVKVPIVVAPAVITQATPVAPKSPVSSAKADDNGKSTSFTFSGPADVSNVVIDIKKDNDAIKSVEKKAATTAQKITDNAKDEISELKISIREAEKNLRYVKNLEQSNENPRLRSYFENRMDKAKDRLEKEEKKLTKKMEEL